SLLVCCLYVFPAKVEPAKIAWECPEKNYAQGEGSMAKKVKRLLKKQVVRIMSCTPDTQCPRDHSMEDPDKKGEARAKSEAGSVSPEEPPDGSASPVEMQDEGPEEPQEAGEPLPPFVLKEGGDDGLHLAEQDADDEAADDTDDTSSVTSSASSTTSSQSGSGTSRKKSIPLSIKNLKRKHKRKKSKITRDFKPGDRVALEVVTTMTLADMMWQDGSVECNICSNDLFPVHHLDNNEFCPGDFVVDKRVQSCPDPAVYGVVQSGDHIGCTCMVKWFKLQPSGDDVEPSVGQVACVDVSSKVEVPEKPTWEKKFLDDIKKLQENLKKTLDNMAIAEEEKMEAVPDTERKDDNPEGQLLVKVEWPSETPVLCQQCGRKPGVTFTSAKGEVFSVLEFAPSNHSFKKIEFQPPEAKFFSTVWKEMALLATSLPDGIMIKTFEDRMASGLVGVCGCLNPNLYDNGKVCVSLLGTWIGKGTERWTSKSSLLQVLISIQGLILVNEPYYNEAGFDLARGLQEGYENSRCYNEMALIRVVQSMTQLVRRPPEVFKQEIWKHFSTGGWRLVNHMESWLETHPLLERAQALPNGIPKD
ncbi:(E3-independent) E2 ubiquitin-conjugating enzyme-like, partial [Nannospalax galili]|uniref:(E3-independent) E2 ubiquitin-conjugating enzyme-like n=1 Tax=Nannospalax galili TaxID=1026970 RepID=UPI00111C6FFF